MNRRLISFQNFLLAFLVALFLIPAARVSGQAGVADHPRVQEAARLLETWMQAQRDYEGIPGASLAVVHDQEVVFAKGFGYAHVEERVPATPSTMYSICSISKLFTSISMMQLRDQGLVSLRDGVGDHLEWFDLRQQFSDFGPVTIEGILTHSSGLPREADASYWSGPDFPFPTHEQIVEGLSNQEMLYPARTHYQYSNLGLTLAGEIVMAKSGMAWRDYVQQHILGPLGMENTTTEHLDELRGNQLATGYSSKQRDGTRTEIPPYQVRGIGPAAGMLSTVEDLAKFASWQFRLLDGEDEGILNRNTLREMYRVHWQEPDGNASRGLGFSVSNRDGKTFVGHGGSCPGYESNLTIRPQDKIATTFMTNGRRVSSGAFARTAFDIMAPAIRAAVKDSEGEGGVDLDLEKYTGLYSRPLGTESAVLTWEGQLAVVGLPTSNPLGGMTKLKHMEGDSFRRVLSGGELGEEYLFEESADGTMTYWVHNNPRVRSARLPG
jgi:CubicO group peptidase (beta-lactamase class C family)